MSSAGQRTLESFEEEEQKSVGSNPVVDPIARSRRSIARLDLGSTTGNGPESEAAALESLLEKPDEELEQELKSEEQASAISKYLREHYDLLKKLGAAEASIDKSLSELGLASISRNLSSINLRFSNF